MPNRREGPGWVGPDARRSCGHQLSRTVHQQECDAFDVTAAVWRVQRKTKPRWQRRASHHKIAHRVATETANAVEIAASTALRGLVDCAIAHHGEPALPSRSTIRRV